MLGKILNISLKVIGALFAFYLFLGFVLIPFGLGWAIRDQGSKLLKHPVDVKTVQFNPFLWCLDIYGLEIKDKDGSVMAGWGRLGVDVSFLSLFKKPYRVESVILDGLKINAVMSAGNHINLMDLVPSSSDEKPSADPKASGPGAALPEVVVDDIVLKNGAVRFSDKTIEPSFGVMLSAMNAQVLGVSTHPQSVTTVHFETRLDEKGTIAVEAALKPFAQPLELETTLTLNNYALTAVTPYTGKYTGRAMQEGKFDFKTTYRISDNKLTASHKVLIQKFEFGQKVDSKDALPLPFGLVIALLEDAQERINISLPVTGDMSSPDFHYWSLVGQVVKNFFMGLVTKPFAFLGSMLGVESGTEDLAYVRFLPGKADLDEKEKVKMSTLAKGLLERPKLILEVQGAYDPQMDWKALKDEAIAQEYQELRRQSSKTDSWIYQLMYQRHFGIQELWVLSKKFKTKQGEYEDAALVDDIKRELRDRAPADLAVLEALASARARAVEAFFLAAGFDPQRLRVGVTHEVQGSLGSVPLEFVLTVFDSAVSDEASPPAAEGEKLP